MRATYDGHRLVLEFENRTEALVMRRIAGMDVSIPDRVSDRFGFSDTALEMLRCLQRTLGPAPSYSPEADIDDIAEGNE